MTIHPSQSVTSQLLVLIGGHFVDLFLSRGDLFVIHPLRSVIIIMSDRSPEEAGDVLMREGEKASTTSMFRWKPDWEKASKSFENAAAMYAKMGEKGLDKRVKALCGAAKASEEMSCLNFAARHFAMATGLMQRAGRKKEAADLARLASSMFHQNNQPRKAADELGIMNVFHISVVVYSKHVFGSSQSGKDVGGRG